jgi:hypothetical protein
MDLTMDDSEREIAEVADLYKARIIAALNTMTLDDVRQLVDEMETRTGRIGTDGCGRGDG